MLGLLNPKAGDHKNEAAFETGAKITVYDHLRNELGKGTFKVREYQAERDLTVYECEEHVMLAKGEHYILVAGKTFHIKSGQG